MKPNCGGTKLSFEYPIVKLQDYWDKWDELEQSTNPFASVVMAHLQTLKTHNKPKSRYEIKWWLIRRLYDQGYSKVDIEKLFYFIDRLMWLPEDMDDEFMEDIGASNY